LRVDFGAREALKTGTVRAARNWRLLFIFYAFNFLAAAVMALPFATVFARDVSRSLAGSDLLRGFSYRWYVEFVHANSTYFGALLPQILVLATLYILAEVFMAGGFYWSLSGKSAVKPREFFAKSTSLFFPLMLATLIEIALLVILYEANQFWAAADRHAAQAAIMERLILHAELWRYGIVAVVFLTINLFADFARAAVSIDGDDFWPKMKRGCGFVVKHPLSALAVYLGATLLSVVVVASFVLFRFGVHGDTLAAVFGEIAASQIFILFRIFAKLIFYSAEACLYKENQIEVIKVKPEMLE